MRTKNFKRVLAITLILAMILSGTIQALGAQQSNDVFSDISGHWAREAILNAYETNLVTGYPDGTFRPDSFITRAETVTILNNHFNMTSREPVLFTDVSPGYWFYSAVSAAVSAGYVSGFPDETFRPNANLTRFHAALMKHRILGSLQPSDLSVIDNFTDVERILTGNSENLYAIAFFVENQIMLGYADQTLRLDNPITRAEFLTLLTRVIALDNVEEADDSEDGYAQPTAPTAPTTTPSTPGGGGGAGGWVGGTSHFLITVTAKESGSVSEGGVFAFGSSVTLTATPDEGFYFYGWFENGERVYADAEYTFTVTRARTLQARFVTAITVTAGEGGSVSEGGVFAFGSSVTLTATPDEGFYFYGWFENGERVYADEEYTFTVTRARTLQARFVDADRWAVSLVCVYRTWDSVYHMSVTIGTRMRGMPGEEAAIDWLIAEFEALGLETEKHTFDSAANSMMQNIGYITIHNAENFCGVGRFLGGIVDGRERWGGPFVLPYHGRVWEVGAAANGLITSMTGPAEGVTGEVVFIGDIPAALNNAAGIRALFEAAEIEHGTLEGKIAMVGLRQPTAAIVNIAMEFDVAGVMGHSVTGGRGNFGAASSPSVTAGTPIPVVGLALAQAEWLKAFLEQEPVTVTIHTQRYDTPVSWNAIGRKPAINNPDTAPIFYIFGHIDTVIGAPGANDNASGVAVTLEAARALSQLHTPDVELRFVGFGHEESGLRGANQYILRMPTEERDRIAGVFNMDMTASSDFVEAPYWTMSTVNGLPNLVTNTFIATADRLGFYGILQLAQFSSSDHVPFHNAMRTGMTGGAANAANNPYRIPAAMGIWLGRVNPGMITPSNYTVERYYHTPQDTIWENICKERLNMCIQIVTASVYYMARNYLLHYATVAPITASSLDMPTRIYPDINEINGSWYEFELEMVS
ncbi:MAG: M20/M25/M40 family metallo-hydrolase [Oscillospiraceae bacterium]|nr:M20/M25/M40 family metallo-hydrolase [Oscillospiraceae bacterium]